MFRNLMGKNYCGCVPATNSQQPNSKIKNGTWFILYKLISKLMVIIKKMLEVDVNGVFIWLVTAQATNFALTSS